MFCESSLTAFQFSAMAGSGMQRDLAPLRGAVGDQQQVANFGDLQRRAADPRLVDQRRGIEQAVKIKVPAGAEISAQLFGELLLALDPLSGHAKA